MHPNCRYTIVSIANEMNEASMQPSKTAMPELQQSVYGLRIHGQTAET